MENVTNEQLKALASPFPSKDVAWRVGAMTSDKKKGQALPYIDVRAVENRLDEVVGVGNWRDEYQFIEANGQSGVICKLFIMIAGEWVAKTDAVEIERRDDSEKNPIDRVKSGVSDALKRAAVKWGIGRYIYAYDGPWVELDDRKRIVKNPTLPDWALPDAERKGHKAGSKPANQASEEKSSGYDIEADLKRIEAEKSLQGLLKAEKAMAERYVGDNLKRATDTIAARRKALSALAPTA